MRFRDMPKLPLVMIAAMFAIGAVMYSRLPARIPIHWGPSGQIDGWAEKSFLSVFGQPLAAVAIYALFLLMPYLDPKRANLLKSKQLYDLILDLVTGLFFVVFVGSLLAAFDARLPIDRIISVGVGVMFLAIGNYLGRVKQNWTMGIRLSWTLADETVWDRTHRMGRWLFVAAGLLAMLGTLVPAPANWLLVLVPCLAILPVTYVYSMLLYRRRHPEEYSAQPR